MKKVTLFILMASIYSTLDAQTMKVYKGSVTTPIYEINAADSVIVSGDISYVPEDVDVPQDAIHVYEAVKICSQLKNGESTQSVYHVKGWITTINNSTPSDIGQHGNATFSITDLPYLRSAAIFQAYRVYGKNGQKLTNINQIELGDYVVIEGKLTNYCGIAETSTKDTPHIYSSSNPNF